MNRSRLQNLNGWLLRNLMGIAFSFAFFLVASSQSLCAQEVTGVVFEKREVLLKGKALDLFEKTLSSSFYEKDKEINHLFFKYPKSSSPFLVLSQKMGKTVAKRIDSNGDGFFEIEEGQVKGAPYVYQELFATEGQKFHNLRIRYYPLGNNHLFEKVVEYRKKKSSPYQEISRIKAPKIAAYESGSNFQLVNKCLPQETISLSGGQLVEDVNAIIKSFDIDYPRHNKVSRDLMVMTEVDKKCQEKTDDLFDGRGGDFNRLIEDAINQGLNCLSNLGSQGRRAYVRAGRDPNFQTTSMAEFLYMNSAAALVGQKIFESPMSLSDVDRNGFPKRVPRNKRNFTMQPLSIICSEESTRFRSQDLLSSQNETGQRGELLGYASLGRDDKPVPLKCEQGEIHVTPPYVSLNFEKLKKQFSRNKQTRDENSEELKELIFHEFLHTTGMEHNSWYDPVESCSKYCFNQGTQAQLESYRRACEGLDSVAMTNEGLERRGVLQAEVHRDRGISKERSIEFMKGGISQMLPNVDTNSIISRVQGQVSY